MGERFRKVQQAYREFPWRKQVRWVSWALAVVLAVVLTFAFEIHLSSQALVLSQQLRALQYAMASEQSQSVIWETHLAQLRSVDHLLRVAEAEGYQPVAPERKHFVPVPPEALSAPAAPLQVAVSGAGLHQPALKEDYTLSLFTWLSRHLLLEAGQ